MSAENRTPSAASIGSGGENLQPAAQDRFRYPDPAPWGRDDWSEATVEEMREHLERIGPMWGNSKLLASFVIEGFWIAYEALNRLEKP